jgi:hypothetical protein
MINKNVKLEQELRESKEKIQALEARLMVGNIQSLLPPKYPTTQSQPIHDTNQGNLLHQAYLSRIRFLESQLKESNQKNQLLMESHQQKIESIRQKHAEQKTLLSIEIFELQQTINSM